MSGVKLVNLGLPKSGTTTLALALDRAGWVAADHKVRRIHTRVVGLGGTFIGKQLYDAYFAGGDPFALLDDLYDALTEVSVLKGTLSLWPQCDYAMLRAMRQARPGMLYVATWRPPADISDSMRRWTNLGSERLPRGAVPGLPCGYGDTDDQRMRWIEGHYAMLDEVFARDPHFLRLDVRAPDAADQLAAHIGRPVPWWGQANRNPGGIA
ncbi:hypothetical protein [Ponticoccus sp. (in: a-proteobacteria)]|uniref:hypothetical protein n=1 Tax=Ponticoccus sp. (in: a-proteobacteria) TaxID=1925025 RepID=UPI003AB76086